MKKEFGYSGRISLAMVKIEQTPTLTIEELAKKNAALEKQNEALMAKLNWKKPRARVRNLIRLKVPYGKAYEWGNTRKGYWRISKSPILHRTLGNSYWESQGLKSLQVRYETLRYSS